MEKLDLDLKLSQIYCIDYWYDIDIEKYSNQTRWEKYNNIKNISKYIEFYLHLRRKYFQKDYTIALYNQFEKDDTCSYNYTIDSYTYKLKGVKINYKSLFAPIVVKYINYVVIKKGYYYISPNDVVSLIEHFRETLNNIMKLYEDKDINSFDSNKCYICQENTSIIVINPCNHTCICKQCQNDSDWSKLFVKSCPKCKELVITNDNIK